MTSTHRGASGGRLSDSRARFVTTIVAVALFVVWLTAQLILGQPNFRGSGFERVAGVQLAYAGLFLVYGAYLAWRRRLPSALPFDAAVALVLATLVISAVAAVNRTVSIESAALTAAPVLALYAMHDFPFLTMQRLVRALVVVVLVAALFGLLEEAILYARWLELVEAVTGGRDLVPPTVPRSGGLMNPNEQIAVLNLGLPFAALLVLRPFRRFDRWLGAVAVLVVLPAAFVTLTRGGWLATAASLAAFGVLYLLSSRDSLRGLVERLPLRKLAVAGVLAAVLAAAAAGLAWESRPQWLFRETISIRQEAAARGIDIVEDRPLFGAGANSYGLLYESVGGEHAYANVHPHNLYLNVLVEAGVAGAVLLTVAVFVFAAWLWRSFFAAEVQSRLVLSACVAALASMAVQGLFNSLQAFNHLLILVAVIVVIAVRAAPSQRAGTSRAPYSATSFAVAVLLSFVMAIWLFAGVVHRDYADSIDLMRAGQTAGASAAASRAADRQPSSAAYQLQAGVLKVLEYRGGGPASGLADGVDHLRRAVDADPYSAIARANLAQALLELGEADEAANEAGEALRIAPHNPDVAAVAGTVLEAAGRSDLAVEAYGLAVRAEPRLAQAPFWNSTELRRDLRNAVLASSQASACRLGGAAVLYGAYDDDLTLLLVACLAEDAPKDAAGAPSADRAFLYYALGRHDELRNEADQLQDAAPGSTGAHVAAGLGDAAAGDLEGARREWMIASYLGDLDAAVLLAHTYGSGTGSKDVSRFLRIPASAGPIPAPVLKMTEPAGAPEVGSANLRSYRTQRYYFEIHHLREAPLVVLLPGDWLDLVSPPQALFPEALNR